MKIQSEHQQKHGYLMHHQNHQFKRYPIFSLWNELPKFLITNATLGLEFKRYECQFLKLKYSALIVLYRCLKFPKMLVNL